MSGIYRKSIESIAALYCKGAVDRCNGVHQTLHSFETIRRVIGTELARGLPPIAPHDPVAAIAAHGSGGGVITRC